MAGRKVIWTKKATVERREILEYWISRNKSKSYSIKLNDLFVTAVSRLAVYPAVGRKTDIENVRVQIIRDYLLFYEYDDRYLKSAGNSRWET